MKSEFVKLIMALPCREREEHLVVEGHRQGNELYTIVIPPDQLPGRSGVHKDLLDVICTRNMSLSATSKRNSNAAHCAAFLRRCSRTNTCVLLQVDEDSRAYAWCCDFQPAMTLKPELLSDCTASALPGAAGLLSSPRYTRQVNPNRATRPAPAHSRRHDP